MAILNIRAQDVPSISHAEMGMEKNILLEGVWGVQQGVERMP